MKSHTPYQQRIRKCFAVAFRFLDTYKHPRTDIEWQRIVKSYREQTDPLTADLMLAVMNELEAEYESTTGRKGV